LGKPTRTVERPGHRRAAGPPAEPEPGQPAGPARRCGPRGPRRVRCGGADRRTGRRTGPGGRSPRPLRAATHRNFTLPAVLPAPAFAAVWDGPIGRGRCRMPPEDRSRTVDGPAAGSLLERARTAYHGRPPRARLVAALVVLAAVALGALVVRLPVLHSVDPVATALVWLGWLALARLLLQVRIPVADRGVLLLLPLIPVLVTVAAVRIKEFPVWHTTLLALLVALIAGLAVGLGGMLTGAAPPALGLISAACAAGLALAWRAVAGYRLRRGMRPTPGSAAARPAAGARPEGPRPPAAPRQRAAAGGPAAPRRSAEEQDEEAPVPVDQALARLEETIGLDPVKQQVRAIAASIEAARLRADAGYAVDKPLRHLVFSGPPGTGKTSVARTLATIFHSFGLLPTSRVVEAHRADLVGEYLGATAIKTNELFDRALGGVLFIDEAYSLVNDGDGQPDRFGA